MGGGGGEGEGRGIIRVANQLRRGFGSKRDQRSGA